MVTFLLVFPFSIGFYLTNYRDLDDPITKKKYGSFYRDLRLIEGKSVLLQPIWFLMRRFILAMAVVFKQFILIWQISLLTMTVVTQVIILGRV